jgi:restriction endonuclease Mrr
MGGVVISPKLKKTSVRIDMYGNEIDPVTKQVIKPAEEEYKPTPQEIEAVKNKPKEASEAKEAPKSDPLGDKIEKMIEDKINKIIEEKVNKVLEKLL